MKPNVQMRPIVLKNNRSNDTIQGVVSSEEMIEDKAYWVVVPDNRPGVKLRFAKDAWSIVKGKK